MSEHDNDPTAPIDLGDVADEPAQEDTVEGEPGWDSRDEDGTATEDDAQ